MNKLLLIWPPIDANINDQLPKSQKTACKAYQYVFFSEKKCQYAFQLAKEMPVCHIPVHTIPLRALIQV